MVALSFVSFFVFSLVSSGAAQAETASKAVGLDLDPSLMESVAECRASGTLHAPRVVMMKQGRPESQANQNGYLQLERWIEDHKLRTVLTEGCEGTLPNSKTAASRRGVAGRASEVPAGTAEPVATASRLKARFGDRVQAQCGDQSNLMKEQSELLAEAKGAVTFFSRLSQYKDDAARSRIYLDGVAQLYGLEESITVPGALTHLRGQLRSVATRLRAVIQRRAEKMAGTISRAVASTGAGSVAVLTQGISAARLVPLLEGANMACSILEPKGYTREAETILEKLDRVLEMTPDLEPRSPATP